MAIHPQLPNSIKRGNTLSSDETREGTVMTGQPAPQKSVSEQKQILLNHLPTTLAALAALVVDSVAMISGRFPFEAVLILFCVSLTGAGATVRPRTTMNKSGARIGLQDLKIPFAVFLATILLDGLIIIMVKPNQGTDMLAASIGLSLVISSVLLNALADNHSLLRTLTTSTAALGESEDRFRELIINSSDIITVVDQQSYVQFITPAVTRLLGINEDDMLGNQLMEFLHPEDRQKFARSLQEAAGLKTKQGGFQFRIRDRHLSWRTLEATPTNLLEHPAVRGIVLNTRDVTERQALENELRHQAYHDSLTSLANRSLFHDRLVLAMKRYQTSGDMFALVLIDLDDFKLINDSLGHAEGDELLRVASQRMLKCLRGTDTAARLGGDEFALLLEGRSEDIPALEVANRLQRGLEQPLTLANKQVMIRASIGVALPEPGLNPDDVMRHADTAMYKAKSLGKGQCVVFEQSLEDSAHERLQFQSELTKAVERSEFVLHYQPIVNLENGELDGVEALIRWQHPERGLLAPDDFILAAEANASQILPISTFVLNEACAQARRWELLFPNREIEVSINVSATHLQSQNFVSDVVRAINASHVSPSRLVLELTETAVLADMESSVAKVKQIREMGVRFALDDFGTGYSSLGYLRELPIDIVKIDRSFLVQIGEQPEHTELVRAIQALAVSLDLKTIAEGVETREQLGVMRALQIDRAQGYLFAYPAEPLQIEKLLTAGRFDVSNTQGFAVAATPPPAASA